MLIDTESCCRIISSFKVKILILKVERTQKPPLLLASPNPLDSTVKHKPYKYLKLKESGNTQWDGKVIAPTALLIYIEESLKFFLALLAASQHFPAYLQWGLTLPCKPQPRVLLLPKSSQVLASVSHPEKLQVENHTLHPAADLC